MEKENKFKISGKSDPAKVAGAIAGAIRECGKVELSSIGAGAVNQCVKSIAIARSYVAPQGINLVCVPAFCDAVVNNEKRTGMKFIIKEDK